MLPVEGLTRLCSEVEGECGIFILPDGRRYVMAVCTKTPNKAKAVHLIQRMGLAVYEAMK